MAFWDLTTTGTPPSYVRGEMSSDTLKGSIRHAGNIASANWVSHQLGRSHGDLSLHGSVVVSGAGGEVTSTLLNGTFAGGDQVIRRVTTDLAGVANTELRSGGSDSANRSRSVKDLNALHTLYTKRGIRNNNWDEFSAAWDAGTPDNATSGIWNQDSDADVADNADATDDAANPTQDVPGALTYRDGSANPINDTYKAKNIW